VAVHNLAAAPAKPRLELGGEPLEGLVDLFDHDELRPSRSGRVEVPLGPYGHRWFRVRRPGQRVAP